MLSNHEATVTITKRELLSLKIAAAELERLEGAGVDNWQGREFVYGTDLFDQDWDTECEQIKAEVEAM